MVDLIVDNAPAPLVGTCVFESDMAEVLKSMVLAGYGIAWLPDCTVDHHSDSLVALGDERWAMTLSVVAYRDRTSNRPAMKRLWAGLMSEQDQ